MPNDYTSGHCANKKQPGGCQLNNSQCWWPKCDRKPSGGHAVAAPLVEENTRLKERLRSVCQTLVTTVGADGPCDAEDAAARAVARIAELERSHSEFVDARRAWLASDDIKQSAIDRLRAELAREQKRRREIDDEAFEYAEQVESLRAEVEALRAKIDRAEVSYGNMLRADDKRPDGTTEYTRGWGDCLRAIAAQRGEGE